MDKIRKGSDLRKEKWRSPSIQESKIAAKFSKQLSIRTVTSLRDISSWTDSTLSSVYVTTESHEKRMRVAEQCAFASHWQYHVVSHFNSKFFVNLRHRRGFPPLTYLERMVSLNPKTYQIFF